MAVHTILIIRHGEKPEPDGSPGGIDEAGMPNAESLTPLGWQRAGAWAGLFVPSLGAERPLPIPAALFASLPLKHGALPVGSKSLRPMETITPLSKKLGLVIDLTFSKGEEAGLANAVVKTAGVVLVCWQHESIGGHRSGHRARTGRRSRLVAARQVQRHLPSGSAGQGFPFHLRASRSRPACWRSRDAYLARIIHQG